MLKCHINNFVRAFFFGRILGRRIISYFQEDRGSEFPTGVGMNREKQALEQLEI